MKSVALAMIALAVAQAPTPQPQVAPPVSAALAPWGGVWIPESIEFDGKQELTGESKSKIRLAVAGTEYRMYFVTDPAKMIGRRISTVDLTANDKTGTFEMTVKDGYRKGERKHGIYTISENTLKICYGDADKPRPNAFAASKGGNVFNEVWVRDGK